MKEYHFYNYKTRQHFVKICNTQEEIDAFEKWLSWQFDVNVYYEGKVLDKGE